MKKLLLLLVFPLLLLANSDRPPVKHDFLAQKNVQNFIDTMVKKHRFERSYLEKVLGNARLDRDTLARYTGQYKVGTTNGPWERYKAHVLDPVTLAKAKKFKRNYASTLNKASRQYKVPVEYIVGFIAVESKFGEYTGDYRLLDSLSTLAFYPNRMQKFFYSELTHFFLMCREEGFDPYRLQGSFAGAMGCVQQVPSVYRRYGMDYDRDGKKDPWSLKDSIGIIASFMSRNGWRNGTPAAIEAEYRSPISIATGHKRKYPLASLTAKGITPKAKFTESTAYLLSVGDKKSREVYLGTSNFRILTRYNNATTYGMAIHKIAEYVKE